MTQKFRRKVAIRGPLTVGKDDYGYDVTMYGAGDGVFWRWDESIDTMVRDGGTIYVKAVASGDGGITVSSGGMHETLSPVEAGYITIQVGDTTYEIPFYASS